MKDKEKFNTYGLGVSQDGEIILFDKDVGMPVPVSSLLKELNDEERMDLIQQVLYVKKECTHMLNFWERKPT